MDLHFAFDPAPLAAFWHQYGAIVTGGAVLLAGFGSRRMGPVRLVALVVGLGMFLTGVTKLWPK